MNPSEIRATVALSLISALRMLGMFMILPVFALYAAGLPGGVTPLQIGLTIGTYGLVQAVLQIPFGMLSDHLGRKPVIVGGLLVFAVGSFVAGATHDIHWIIAGRSLQGAGAISGVVSALLADATRTQVRTQAMAIFGAGMGVSFILALVLGPLFSGWIGVDGIFRMTGVLALLAIPLLLKLVPAVPKPAAEESARTLTRLRAVLADSQMLRLDGGIFLLHTMMTALFIAAPHAIETTLGLPARRHWEVYLPVLLVSVIPVFPMIRWIEASGRVRTAFVAAVAMLGAALLLASLSWMHITGLLAALLLFFVAFNYLEGSLPSMISRRAPVAQKGAALGIYSSAQVLGGFAGGSLGGYMLGHSGISGVFAAAALLSLVWLCFAVGIVPPALHATAHEAVRNN
jgi:MFS family permease